MLYGFGQTRTGNVLSNSTSSALRGSQFSYKPNGLHYQSLTDTKRVTAACADVTPNGVKYPIRLELMMVVLQTTAFPLG